MSRVATYKRQDLILFFRRVYPSNEGYIFTARGTESGLQSTFGDGLKPATLSTTVSHSNHSLRRLADKIMHDYIVIDY